MQLVEVYLYFCIFLIATNRFCDNYGIAVQKRVLRIKGVVFTFDFVH
jgi:hypothetical protein